MFIWQQFEKNIFGSVQNGKYYLWIWFINLCKIAHVQTKHKQKENNFGLLWIYVGIFYEN